MRAGDGAVRAKSGALAKDRRSVVERHHADQPEAAKALYKESLALCQAAGNQRGVATCLEELAEVAGAQGQAEWAVRLLGAAEAQRQATDFPIEAINRPGYDRSLLAARAQLDEAAFAAAWAAGRAMTLDGAIAYAVADEPK